MEVLIAIGIFLFIMVMVWLFVKQGYSFQSFTFGQTTAITEARRGVETMVKEIREALPGDTGDFNIESAEEFEFVFYTDYDRDNQVEKVRYYIDGSNFNKGVIEASGSPLQYNPLDEQVNTLSRYVRNTSTEEMFLYYNDDYDLLSSPVNPINIRLVRVYLKINVFPDKAPADFHLESMVGLRNLKDNF